MVLQTCYDQCKLAVALEAFPNKQDLGKVVIF
jgi:hypothetical protein